MNGTCAKKGLEKVPRKTIANAYLNIFSVFVRCHDLDDKMGNVCRDGLPGDMLNERAKLHWQPLFILCRTKSQQPIQLHAGNDNRQLPAVTQLRTFFFPINELQSMLTP